MGTPQSNKSSNIVSNKSKVVGESSPAIDAGTKNKIGVSVTEKTDDFVLPVKNVVPKLEPEEPLMESMREFEEIMRKKKAKSFRFFDGKGNEEIEFVPGIYKFDESYISRRADKIANDSIDGKGFVYVSAKSREDLVEYVDGTNIFRLVKKD